MAKFIITRSCYLQQDGQTEPVYVAASPDKPATVCLAEGAKPAPWMVPVAKAAEMQPLRPAHAEIKPHAVKSAAVASKVRESDK